MSSVEFHEDEWGRHWSYAPALHGTVRSQPYSILPSVRGWVSQLVETIAGHLAEDSRERLLQDLSPTTLRDIYPEDSIPSSRYTRLEGVKDAFGRPVV
jgi:hypothetical protein